MKAIRSVAAVILGWLVSSIAMTVLHTISFVLYLPADKKLFDWMKEFQEPTPAAKEWLSSLPASAMVSVLLAWEAGAFFGGMVSALIAGRARVLHGGIIGVLVLAGTIFNALDIKEKYGFSHPDWMLIAGLLLPLPVSMLAGRIVSAMSAPQGAEPKVS